MPQLLCELLCRHKTTSLVSATFHLLYQLNCELQACVEHLNVHKLFQCSHSGMIPNRFYLNPGLVDPRNIDVSSRHPANLPRARAATALVPKQLSPRSAVYSRNSVFFPIQNYVPYPLANNVLLHSIATLAVLKSVASGHFESDVRENIRADILKKINHCSQSDSPVAEKFTSPNILSHIVNCPMSSNRLSPASKPVSASGISPVPSQVSPSRLSLVTNQVSSSRLSPVSNTMSSESTSKQDKMYTSKLGKRSRQSSPKYSPKKARKEENKQRQKSPIPDNILPSTPSGSTTDKISEAIWCYYVQQRQTEDIYQRKIQLRNALYAVLKGVFPYCGLYIVGSSMSGFGTKTSDMDLCLMLSPAQIDQKKEATEILFMIHRAIRKCSFIKSPTVIRAKVPIMKFFDHISGVECDLNVNNSVGIRNTHLLRYYASMDWRVRPLMLFIKHWARFHDINDARKMTLSSYSLALMLIHYLQSCKPPVLPCLQTLYPDHFNPSTDIRDLKLSAPLSMQKMHNSDSMGDLFLGFLRYYTCDFDYKSQAISVRKGCRIQRSSLHSLDSPSQWKCFCIEEPFDGSNTARAVYDEYTFTRIYRVIRNSYLKLEQTKDVEEILKFPF